MPQEPQSKCSGETVGMVVPGTSNEINAFSVSANVNSDGEEVNRSIYEHQQQARRDDRQ